MISILRSHRCPPSTKPPNVDYRADARGNNAFARCNMPRRGNTGDSVNQIPFAAVKEAFESRSDFSWRPVDNSRAARRRKAADAGEMELGNES
jgi:hypothetical protein